MTNLSRKELHTIAVRHGGVYLNTAEADLRTKVKWACARGHSFSMEPILITNGGMWCRKCSATRKGTLKQMQAFALLKNGKCISRRYISQKTNATWECQNNHRWQTSFDKIKRGQWCPHCSGRRQTIDDMKALAKANGGSCLSETYLGTQRKLRWQCSEGHQWEAQPLGIKQGAWCPKCRGVAKRTIEEMKAIAKSRGGECLSERIVNIKSDLTWKCKLGHIWTATAQNVANNNSWCPQCSNKKTERICREYFQEIFQEPFPTKRPKWLFNDRHHSMELDGYSERLGIAFEYHGIQHFQVLSYTKSQEQLKQRKTDDRLKVKLCRKHGVNLFIPDHATLPQEFPAKILEQAISLGIDTGSYNFNVKITEANLSSPNLVKEMQRIAKSHGGRLISKSCSDSQDNLTWECIRGHTFKARAINVRSGSWCSKCGHEQSKAKRKHPLNYVQALAKENGGTLISTQYVNSWKALEWECKVGHRWYASLANVQSGHWCRICSLEMVAAKRRLGIEAMKDLALSRQGTCISDVYINAHSPLEWECKFRHRWKASPSSIKSGTWCPDCRLRMHESRNRNRTIEDMKAFAASRGGKCLSNRYTDVSTDLTWTCERGHIWEAPFARVKTRSWCPTCARLKTVRYNIEDLKNYAKSKGGICLSSKYDTGKVKLRWQCKAGHKFESRWDQVQAGKWCKLCSSARTRDSIEMMNAIARERGGKCISDKYVHGQEILLWECQEMHRFEARPSNIKRGSWCPICAIVNRYKRGKS